MTSDFHFDALISAFEELLKRIPLQTLSMAHARQLCIESIFWKLYYQKQYICVNFYVLGTALMTGGTRKNGIFW